MFARLLVLFVTIPLIELYLLLKVNELTGSAITTIGLILFTGALGAWLAKQQGLSTIGKIQRALSEGRMPAAELVDGGMILFAGALLLTPGIMTDAFGFSLLIPPCRVVYRKLLKQMFPQANIKFHSTGFSGAPFERGVDDDPNVVDGSVNDSQNAYEPPQNPQLPKQCPLRVASGPARQETQCDCRFSIR